MISMENIDFEKFFEILDRGPPKEFLMELFRFIEKKKLREINDLKLLLVRKKFLNPSDFQRSITYDMANGQEQIEFLKEHRKKLAGLLEGNLARIKVLETEKAELEENYNTLQIIKGKLEDRVNELENEIKIKVDMESDLIE